jgi:VanZ family protein
MAAAERRSSSAPLALAWAALILWATLYPFGPWRWPPGTLLSDLLRLPWPRYTDSFDTLSNLLGYAPLGLLGYVVAVRHGASRVRAVLLVTLGDSALSC